MTVTTRFAPSPTGYLHIGGVRTALFSWLYARHENGKAILRIEDTDLARSTEASIQAILEGMDWLGLAFDGEVTYQTHRFDRYREVIDQLVAQGKAYRCHCSKERLEKLREEQMEAKQKPKYDGHCRHMKDVPVENSVIRFLQPDGGEVRFEDAVRGSISVQNSELDDLIILRSDGAPTYNLTVVVDDWDMGVTDVIRGDDHINNTPRQINIFKALGAKPPRYAHVPMILGPDGKRLSKRHGAVSVLEYREEGYLPEALLNYLVRLGWSHGDQEIFSLDELCKKFTLDHISKSAAAVNPEKLLWLNQHYLKSFEPSHYRDEFKWQLEKLNISVSDNALLDAVILCQRERVKTLKEMAEKSVYFFQEVKEFDEKAVSKHLTGEVKPLLMAILAAYESLDAWEKGPVHEVILKTAESYDTKLGKIAQPIRVAITGGTVSPPLDETLTLLGKQTVVKRLKRAIESIE